MWPSSSGHAATFLVPTALVPVGVNAHPAGAGQPGGPLGALSAVFGGEEKHRPQPRSSSFAQAAPWAKLASRCWACSRAFPHTTGAAGRHPPWLLLKWHTSNLLRAFNQASSLSCTNVHGTPLRACAV